MSGGYKIQCCVGCSDSITFAGLNFGYQPYRMTVTFINGEYWGFRIYVNWMMWERIAIFYDMEPDSIILMEDNLTGLYQLVNGTDADQQEFTSLRNFIPTNDMNVQANMDYVCVKNGCRKTVLRIIGSQQCLQIRTMRITIRHIGNYVMETHQIPDMVTMVVGDGLRMILTVALIMWQIIIFGLTSHTWWFSWNAWQPMIISEETDFRFGGFDEPISKLLSQLQDWMQWKLCWNRKCRNTLSDGVHLLLWRKWHDGV